MGIHRWESGSRSGLSCTFHLLTDISLCRVIMFICLGIYWLIIYRLSKVKLKKLTYLRKQIFSFLNQWVNSLTSFLTNCLFEVALYCLFVFISMFTLFEKVLFLQIFFKIIKFLYKASPKYCLNDCMTKCSTGMYYHIKCKVELVPYIILYIFSFAWWICPLVVLPSLFVIYLFL